MAHRYSSCSGRRAAGYTLLELLAALLTLTFVVGGGTRLYYVGYQQQKVAENYSIAQTDLRSGLAEANRAIRHGCEVVTASTVYSGITVTQFSPKYYSNTTQLCIRAPQPSATGGYVEIRFYLLNGKFYAERADSVGTLTMLGGALSTVQTLAFNYYQTSGTQRTTVTATPNLATEVQITLKGQSNQGGAPMAISATAVTTVNLRNMIAASGVE